MYSKMAAYKILVLIFLSSIFISQSEGACQHKTDCESCASSRSWIGSCRWCTVTKNCHGFGSPLNPCDKAVNIKKASECPSKKSEKTKDQEEKPAKEDVEDTDVRVFQQEDYSPDRAEKLVRLCKLAYEEASVIENALSSGRV